jgi:hypothetical protein
MNTELIIEHIDAEIAKLQQAKVLLNSETGPITKRAAGRPKTSAVAARILSVAPAKPTKRPMSAAGKAKIAEAQKARWAKVRRAANKTAKAAAVLSIEKALKAPAKSARPNVTSKSVKSSPAPASKS